MSDRPGLKALADYCAILAGYSDWRGTWRDTNENTRAAALHAMGIDASSEAACFRALAVLKEEDDSAPMTLVWDLSRRKIRITSALPAALAGAEAGELSVHDEHGTVVALRRSIAAEAGLSVFRPIDDVTAGYGYYEGLFTFGYATGRTQRACTLLVSPGSCVSVRERSGQHRSLGIALNLYTLRGETNWGIGDLGDVRRLTESVLREDSAKDPSGRPAVGWFGLSPLHAASNRGNGTSPYFPSNRIYSNWIYLDVAAVARRLESHRLRDLLTSPNFAARLDRCRTSTLIDRIEVMRLKREALDILHAEFRRLDPANEHVLAYRAFVAEQGAALDAHATYEALADEQASGDSVVDPDWRDWPVEYHDPASAETAAFRGRNVTRIEFHRWLQFELDSQRAAAGEGLAIGMMADLAVGTAPGGSEVWSERALFADAAVLGAPPDDYSDQGQSWGVVPMLPRALRKTGYAHLRRLLAANLRHCGALRIDHAMGLIRQFWLPAAASTGAYVTFPRDETFAVLAIESRRAGAVVVAEDLGTVPAGFREHLTGQGCLRTHVMYFERTSSGGFASSETYAEASLATPNTHDQPPLLGFCAGNDLRRRAEANALSAGERLADALAARLRECESLFEMLRTEGAMKNDDAADLAVCAAALRMLARSRAELVGIGLDDLGGETVPVNVPGLGAAETNLWSRQMRTKAVDILAQPDVQALLREIAAIMDARRGER